MATFHRLRPNVLKLDLASVTGLQNMTDYASSNPNYTTAAVNVLHEEYQQARASDIGAQNAAKATHDALATAEWALHDAMLELRSRPSPNMALTPMRCRRWA